MANSDSEGAASGGGLSDEHTIDVACEVVSKWLEDDVAQVFLDIARSLLHLRHENRLLRAVHSAYVSAMFVADDFDKYQAEEAKLDAALKAVKDFDDTKQGQGGDHG